MRLEVINGSFDVFRRLDVRRIGDQDIYLDPLFNIRFQHRSLQERDVAIVVFGIDPCGLQSIFGDVRCIDIQTVFFLLQGNGDGS